MSGDVKGSDNAAGWFILAVLAGILLMIFWYYYQYDVRALVRWIRYGEMKIVSVFTDSDYVVPWQKSVLQFDPWLDVVPKLQKSDLSETVSSQIATLALYPLRWIITAILAVLAFWAMFKGPHTQFRKKHNLDTLIGFQSGNFPYISPFVKFNPSNMPPRPPGSPVPADMPLFAEALGPEEWLAYYGIPVPDGKVDKNVAKSAFAKQLGEPWRGWAHLPDYKQVLLAAFCLKAVRKRAEADLMLGQISQAWTHNGGLKMPRGLVKRARSVLRNRDLAGKTMAVCNQHAYTNTALLRALTIAREEGGVLAPSQFLWLRGHDRTLWYPLNNLGRQTYHMEALGAISHFRHEKLTQRPILRPRVEDAANSIADYMASERARPIPSLDYSKSKKTRGIKTLKVKK